MPPDGTPGSARHTGTTARPADEGARAKRLDPAAVRRAVTAVVTLAAAAGASMRRSEARSLVLGYAGDPAELEAYLRATFRMDPTGVTAVRNVARDGGRGV